MFKKINIALFISLILLTLNSCRTDFERIRTGNDVELKYEKAMEFYEKEDYYKAMVLLEQITGIMRNDARIESVYYKYADCNYQLKKYLLSAYYFKNFANTFPNSELAEDALFMAAYSNYELSPNYRLEQGNSDKAIDEFQLFVNTHPESSRVKEANTLIDELRSKKEKKAFAEADLYFKLQDYKAAAHTYNNLLKDFPDANEIERARFMIVKSNFKLAQNSVDYLKEERYEETISAYETFVDRYPDSEFKNEAADIFTASKQRINKFQEND